VYSVLIVDDEPFIRDAFKDLIDREELEILEIHEAYNGQHALDILEKEKIDIVITDLKMPVMDGITLLMKAKKRHPGAKYIVLSAYDDFQLVKTAFNMGIKDYVLKAEMTKDEINRLIRSSENELAVERTIRKCNYSQHNRIWDLYPSLVKMLDKTLAEKGRGRDEKTAAVYILVLCFTKDTDEKSAVGWPGKMRIEECLSNLGPTEELLYSDNHYCIIMGLYADRRDGADRLEYFKAKFRNMQRSAIKNYSATVSAGLAHQSLEHLNGDRLVKHAIQALQGSFLYGKGKLIEYEGVLEIAGKNRIVFSEKIELLERLLRTRNEGEIRRSLNKLCLNPYNCNIRDTCNIKVLFNRYYYIIKDYIGSRGLITDEEFVKRLRTYVHLRKKHLSLSCYNEWLRKILLLLSHKIYSRSSIVDRAIQYIEAHYSERLNLEVIADSSGVSKSYLSRIFSKEMDINLVRYIATIRIEHAKSFLIDSNFKIYEIAEKVGFLNPEHFSRIFKKIVGESPKNYIK